MKKNLQALLIGLIIFMSLTLFVSTGQAQTTVLASWNMFNQSDFGVSPLAPNTPNNFVVATQGLARVGLSTTTGTSPSTAVKTGRWGGRTNAQTLISATSTANSGIFRFFTFALTPAINSTVSFSNISEIPIYISLSSANAFAIQYSLTGVNSPDSYITIQTHNLAELSTRNRVIPATDLSGVTALQNLTSATTVYFRIVPYETNASPGEFNFVLIGAHGADGSTTAAIDATAFSVNGLSTLPVTLSSFTSSIQNQAAFLKWTTESEVNFDYFSVEKRDKNTDFKEIGRVAAKGGNGKTLYSFADKNISFETSYYRLKMVDKDGTFEYSNVIDEVLTSSNQALSIWPNPIVNQVAKVQFKELSIASTLKVIDLSGRVVLNQQLKQGIGYTELDLSKLNKGQYVLLLESNGAKLDYLKFIKED
jgi:hypothetical protein